jgi:protein gp37
MTKTIGKSKIDWCDRVWNFVVGCENNCPYCYAKKYIKRFYKVFFTTEANWHFKNNNYIGIKELSKLLKFKPIYLDEKFNRKFPDKVCSIFVNPFSDLKYWKNNWMENAIKRIKKNPHHQFLFLTKNPEMYLKWRFPINCWLGVTITSDNDFRYNLIENKDFDFMLKNNKIFYSIEPILNIFTPEIHPIVNWYIVGAETGNRKNKIIPEKKWIEDIKKFCQKNNISYFEKNSLNKIIDRNLIKEIPF